MEPNRYFLVVLVLSCILMLDFYVFKGLRLTFLNKLRPKVRKFFKWGYWVWSLGVLFLWAIILLNFEAVLVSIQQTKSYWLPFSSLGIFLIDLIPKTMFSIFHLVEDIIWIINKLIRKSKPRSSKTGVKIDRLTFISQLGLVAGFLQFNWMFYGMNKGRFNFKVHKHKISFKNLPAAFDNLKIVQISDLHLGSFNNNYEQVEESITLINNLKPDIIFFTGDLVNNYAWELNGWEKILKKLQAPMGVFSILGNHDYGDYVQWDSNQEKEANLKELEIRQKDIGFRLLKNESIVIEKSGSEIEIIGVENWGSRSLHNYGDLSLALEKVNKNNFKILLSHDPTHWEAEVLNKTDIELTLSGHTHGMQMGVEIPGFKWSPAQYLYRFWAGMYNIEDQFLYVNRGLGYTLFPGRIGINPEITEIVLFKEQ